MKRYVLAHDIGTSGDKATLFDEKGCLIASASASYGTKYFNGNWAEQSPEDWWLAVCKSSRKVLTYIDTSLLAAVSFSGQMMGCLCVDAHGMPLHDALIYSDQRSTEQARQLIEVGGGLDRVYHITGHRPSSSYTLTKLMWIRDHLPEVYGRTHKVLHAKDYINFKLTGGFFTDYSDASGTNAFDLCTSRWSQELLDAVGISPGLFPDVVSSTTVVGKVHADAAHLTGIPEGTPVVIGAGDGGCATIGAGSVSPGKPYCYMGSSSWVSITSEEPMFDEQMHSFTWAHPIAGLYQPCATMQTAGSAMSWLSGLLQCGSGNADLDKINDMARSVQPGANGVLFLPYLLGERSPWWNPKAKAEFIGMHVNTTREDIARAVIEGIAMNLSLSLQPMLQQTQDSTVMFIGGGAMGTGLRQIFADVFGCDIAIPTLLTEATSMGAALLGGVGAGVYADFSLVEQMNPLSTIVKHDPLHKELYTERTQLLRETYQTVEPLFDKLEDFNMKFSAHQFSGSAACRTN